ncbi:MAG: hypothetical protein KatS3mg026_1460 [Bacteroidia bacterium]|nr:MAG: hypothetical protein KatS3mg026_1460 [Bacteroidia bacterium]
MTRWAAGLHFLESLPSPWEGGQWAFLGARPVYRLQVHQQGSGTQALLEAFWQKWGQAVAAHQPTAVVMASARGSLQPFLEGYETWKAQKRVSPTFSPETTLGTLATWVAHRVGCEGPAWSVSQTCVSGLYALQSALLWHQLHPTEKVLFGAVETPLAPFFVEAMAALRIYSSRTVFPYSLPGTGQNTLALGEAIAVGIVGPLPAPFEITHGVTGTARPEAGQAYTAVAQKPLQRLLAQLGEEPPDFVLLHAPGTRQGDATEWEAVRAVWGPLPALSIKSQVGHSLGAAPLVALRWATYLLEGGPWPQLDYKPFWPSEPPPRRKEAVVIALGFGGAMGAVRIRRV